ncbi:MAG: hypothetical protein LC115_05665 [Bacteroidia bacterium]|nr:hypothetical protein [Bacteroidia bacterium]
MKKKRLLFGAVDIGYRIEHYTKFIHEEFSDKLEVESFSKYVLAKDHFETKYTFTCEIYKKSNFYVYIYLFLFFLRALIRYDIFHFLSGELILTYKYRDLELFLYKLLGKKVIMHFVGADIRSVKYSKWKNDNLKTYLETKINPFPMSDENQLKLINLSKKYADKIIVSTPDLLQIIPDAIYIPVFIDIENFQKIADYKFDKKLPLKILHSPSNKSIKGSTYIIDQLMPLKEMNGIQVEVVIPKKTFDDCNKYYVLSRYELINEMKKSHFLIDQLSIGWYGLQSIEALILGNVVFCYIEDTNIKYLFPNTPIINLNAVNLESVIKENINLSYTNNIVEDNIEWVKKWHTIKSYKNIFYDLWLSK